MLFLYFGFNLGILTNIMNKKFLIVEKYNLNLNYNGWYKLLNFIIIKIHL